MDYISSTPASSPSCLTAAEEYNYKIHHSYLAYFFLKRKTALRLSCKIGRQGDGEQLVGNKTGGGFHLSRNAAYTGIVTITD